MRKTFLSFVILCAFVVHADTWTDPETGYTWTYRINGDTAELYNGYSAAISPSPTNAVSIPSMLGGKPVTSIGYRAFSGCSGLTSVTIPDGVTNIGDSVFCGCSRLTSVTIGNGVTSIGSGAFDGCSGLKSFTVDNGNANYSLVNGLLLSKDGKRLIKGVDMPIVVIPESVTSVDYGAFAGYSGLRDVTMPQYFCDRRMSDMFPAAYQRITNVVISVGVTRIGAGAFKGCSRLTNVTVPESVTSIGDEAFYNCSSLTHLTIPENVTSYGANCFEGCPAYTLQLYRSVFGGSSNNGSSGGLPSVSTTVVQQVESPYTLTNGAADRAIASVTVNGDCSIDSFVLTDGKVYDTVLYVVNTAAAAVHLSLPSGYVYVTPKGKTPLTIPANSMNLLTITRVAASTFLVTRQQLETVK